MRPYFRLVNYYNLPIYIYVYNCIHIYIYINDIIVNYRCILLFMGIIKVYNYLEMGLLKFIYEYLWLLFME